MSADASLQSKVDEVAAAGDFSGVVRVDRGGRTVLAAAYGLADRAHGVRNTVDTLFATASGTKGLTASTVMALVEHGTLSLDTTARSLLGDDLPLVDDAVTVEQLLAHRSGIGDYLDEETMEDIGDYVMPVPVHQLTTTEAYLAVLEGHDSAFTPGERFAYNNGGYVLLALLAERASGTGFAGLVRTFVCEPAGMADTAFLRSDELPGRAARGYLTADGLRTNVLHLPVIGSGDGGIYTTVADMHALWSAFFAGAIVSVGSVAEMVRAREDARYGLGFYVDGSDDAVHLEGYDAGVSFFSAHRPSAGITWTVISNWSDGAWPVVRLLDERLRD